MANISITNTFVPGTSISANELNENFDDIKNVVNNNIEDNNILDTSNITIDTLTASTKITCLSLSVPKNTLGDAAGTYKISITDDNDTELFSVDSSGNIDDKYKSDLLPSGTVAMFKGSWIDNSTIPGWYKCDGNNGTPNLVDKFVRCEATSGNTGGYTDRILPEHTHTASCGNDTGHTHSIQLQWDVQSIDHGHTLYFSISPSGSGTTCAYGILNNQILYTPSQAINDSHTHSFSYTSMSKVGEHAHTITVNNTGSAGSSNDNLPAYYELLFIMKV